MKHYKVDECICKSHSIHCQLNWDHFLFYHDLDFYLISTKPCWNMKDLDSKESVVIEILKKSKFKKAYEILDINSYRLPLDKSFKEERLRGLNLKRNIYEINMFYNYVRSNGENCIATPYKYIDLATKQDELLENYTGSYKYLTENGYKHLIPDLDRLFKANQVLGGIELELQTVKTIDKLIKTIKDEIKTKRKHENTI